VDALRIIQKGAETLTDLTKEVDLDVSAEKTRYALIYHHQDTGQNYDLEKVKKVF
jgi:hypothetical protein